MSAGALLTLGLWPGALRAEADRPGESFRFIVVNDTHCMTPECRPYLQGLVKQMRGEQAEFCLHAGDLTEKIDMNFSLSLLRLKKVKFRRRKTYNLK